MSDYDMKIHSNPDAQAWAKFFIHTKEKASWQIEDIDESLMLAWFANAMMAMHDYLKSQRTEQEPVATVTSETGADITMSWWHEPALPMGTKLFTHPPQRTWVGLASEDRLTAKYMQDAPDGIEAVIDYIESKLKELNT